jgi:RNase H-fold protein (predicted Holliday junction resolvase)
MASGSEATRAKARADELIIGLPVAVDGRETPPSNKVRCVIGRLAVQEAERFVA